LSAPVLIGCDRLVERFGVDPLFEGLSLIFQTVEHPDFGGGKACEAAVGAERVPRPSGPACPL